MLKRFQGYVCSCFVFYMSVLVLFLWCPVYRWIQWLCVVIVPLSVQLAISLKPKLLLICDRALFKQLQYSFQMLNNVAWNSQLVWKWLWNHVKKISMASDQDKFTLVFYGFLFLCDSNKVSCRDGSHEIHCEKSSTKMSHQNRIIIGLELLMIFGKWSICFVAFYVCTVFSLLHS